MKSIKSSISKSLPVGSWVDVCDNSCAKLIGIISVKGHKTRKGRKQEAMVSDLVLASVKKGRPDMRKQVVFAVIVRQKKPYRRPNGIRIKFEDNAAVVLKDDKGNPKGTILKGAIPKEVVERWPPIAKIASIVV